MKTKYILLLLLTTTLFLSSCIEETEPTRGATTDQVAQNPGAMIEAMNSWMIKFNALNKPENEESHWDIGYPGIIIFNELMGQDCFSGKIGYHQQEHYYKTMAYMGPDYVFAQYSWIFFYKLNTLANKVIGVIDPETATKQELYSLGQALSYRAFAYFNMVQMYQFKYKGHENDPAVPIITENTTEQEANNNPRASVEKIYSIILADLKAAIPYLDGFQRMKKNAINKQVAQGLMARVCLTMENWGDAKMYAKEAMAGYSALTKEQWHDPANGFNNSESQNSWLWGCITTNDDDVVQTGICNFTSFMCNEYGGYAYYNPKVMDRQLYNSIQTTDWRKDSWIEKENCLSLKFKPFGGDGNNEYQATHIPLMRVEEMMLIEAEAAGMLSVNDGKSLLDTFVALRNTAAPKSTATNSQELQDEIWMQRRVEFWGEGMSYFDIKRLGKGVTRNYPGTNHIDGYRFNFTVTPGYMNWCITRSETTNNDGIGPEQNNPVSGQPKNNTTYTTPFP